MIGVIAMRTEILQPPPVPDIPKVSPDNDVAQLKNDTNQQPQPRYFPDPDAVETLPSGKRDLKQQLTGTILGLKDGVPDTTSLRYKVDNDTNTIVIQFVDDKTNKVVREIPPHELLETMASICRLVGIHVDETA